MDPVVNLRTTVFFSLAKHFSAIHVSLNSQQREEQARYTVFVGEIYQSSLRFLFTIPKINVGGWGWIEPQPASAGKARLVRFHPSSTLLRRPARSLCSPRHGVLEKDRSRVKRTATWNGRDEWRVLVEKEGSGTTASRGLYPP